MSAIANFHNPISHTAALENDLHALQVLPAPNCNSGGFSPQPAAICSFEPRGQEAASASCRVPRSFPGKQAASLKPELLESSWRMWAAGGP